MSFTAHYVTGIVGYLEQFTELMQISLIGLEKQSLLCPSMAEKCHNFQVLPLPPPPPPNFSE